MSVSLATMAETAGSQIQSGSGISKTTPGKPTKSIFGLNIFVIFTSREAAGQVLGFFLLGGRRRLVSMNDKFSKILLGGRRRFVSMNDKFSKILLGGRR